MPAGTRHARVRSHSETNLDRLARQGTEISKGLNITPTGSLEGLAARNGIGVRRRDHARVIVLGNQRVQPRPTHAAIARVFHYATIVGRLGDVVVPKLKLGSRRDRYGVRHREILVRKDVGVRGEPGMLGGRRTRWTRHTRQLGLHNGQALYGIDRNRPTREEWKNIPRAIELRPVTARVNVEVADFA